MDELYCRAVSGIGQARRARGTRDVLVIQAPETRGTSIDSIQFKLRLLLLGLATSDIEINLATAVIDNILLAPS